MAGCFQGMLRIDYLGGLAQLARAPALHAGGHRFDSDILHLGLLIPGTGLIRRFPEYSITGTFFDILEEKNLREDNSRDVVFPWKGRCAIRKGSMPETRGDSTEIKAPAYTSKRVCGEESKYGHTVDALALRGDEG